MENALIVAALVLLNYLIGSVSSAIIISKFVKKIDIRKVGYKTAGGSNVAHNVGFIWGLIVALFDLLKGIPVLFLAKLINIESIYLSFIAISPVIGHCWPIWFKFSGGRGIGTIFGIILFLTPNLALYPIIIFILTIIPSLIKKYIGVDLKIISSPTMTLMALSCFLFLAFKTEETYDEVLAFLFFIVVLIRRVTARPEEYRSYNQIKLFFSRLIFDNSDIIT